MAKWGESDPRWIVEERPDATNVNNWHWTEKNATEWSKEKLRNLLLHMKISNQFGSAEITEVSKCDGEASANMRKAKLIFFYEWEVKCEWKGILKDSDDSYKGKLSITNLSEENSPEETEIEVSANNEKSTEAYQLKELVRVAGVVKIREVVKQYVDALKREYSQGMILPTKDNKAAAPRESNPSVTSVTKQLDANVITAKCKSVGVKISVTTVKDKASFKCQASDLYQALTNRQMATVWTRGSVSLLEAERGGRFAFFDGNVHGEFLALEPCKEIRMRWRMKNWPDEHYSEAVLQISEGEGETELQLTQTAVPHDQRDATAQGWTRYYWNSMKQVFGWGAPMC